MIEAGRIAGIPFFDVYHYTWGEIEEFVKIQYEKQRAEDIRLAHLAFSSASLLTKMISGAQNDYTLMDEFDWLFTPEEHREAKRQRLKAAIHIKEEPPIEPV